MWKRRASCKKEHYERKNDSLLGMEDLSQQLTAELHSKMDSLVSAPVLSEKWKKMAELCGRIAKISQVEAKLSEDGGTMWEGEEMALRFIMEDGKLNVCLRNLVDFRAYNEKVSDEDERILHQFEHGMGILLKHAWHHSEALQTTDLPLLVDYIADVLTTAEFRPHQSTGRQDILVLHYLHGLARHLEDLHLLNFMTLIQNSKLLEKLILYLDRFHDRIPRNDLLIAVQALSDFLDADDLSTFQDDFIPPHTASLVPAFRDSFLADFLNDYDIRKSIAPLLRFIQQLPPSHSSSSSSSSHK